MEAANKGASMNTGVSVGIKYSPPKGAEAKPVSK